MEKKEYLRRYSVIDLRRYVLLGLSFPVLGDKSERRGVLRSVVVTQDQHAGRSHKRLVNTFDPCIAPEKL